MNWLKLFNKLKLLAKLYLKETGVQEIRKYLEAGNLSQRKKKSKENCGRNWNDEPFEYVINTYMKVLQYIN